MDARRKAILELIAKYGIRGGVDGEPPPAGNPSPTPPANGADMVGRWEEMKGTLPQDIRNTEFVKNSKSFTDMVVQAVNSQKMIGGRIPLPKDENDEKGWGEVYTKLGRPASADDYKIERPANAKDIGYSDELEKSFKDVSHKIGLNTKQANALVKWQTDAVTAEAANDKRIMEEGLAQLRKDWGNNFDTRLAQVKRVVTEYEGSYPGLVEALEKNNLGSNPAFIKFFFDVTEGMVEESGNGHGSGGGGSLSAADAQAEINRLMRDKDFGDAFYNKRNPGHQAAVDKIMELRELTVAQEV